MLVRVARFYMYMWLTPAQQAYLTWPDCCGFNGGLNAVNGELRPAQATPSIEEGSPLTKNEKISALLAQANALEDQFWFEPWGDLQPDDRTEVMSMISLVQPGDSVSLVGARSITQPLGELTKQQVDRLCTVYMRTVLGQHIVARVSTEGLESCSELLLGLRAAFVHYACSPNQGAAPPMGGLRFCFIMKDHSQVVVHEGSDHDIKRLPPIGHLLKCVHIYVDEAPVRQGRNISRAQPAHMALHHTDVCGHVI